MLKSNAKVTRPPKLNSFSRNRNLHDDNPATASERRFLAEVAKLGSIKSEGDLIHLLGFLRDALGSHVTKPS
jgi:hypothetical protein